jgi:hypothetical protein
MGGAPWGFWVAAGVAVVILLLCIWLSHTPHEP